MIIPEILYARTNAKDLVTQQNEIVIRNTITTTALANYLQVGYSPPSDRIFIFTSGVGRATPFDQATSINSIDLEYELNGQTYLFPAVYSPAAAVVGNVRLAAFTGQIWLPGGGRFQLRVVQSAATGAGVTFGVFGITIPRGNTTVG